MVILKEDQLLKLIRVIDFKYLLVFPKNKEVNFQAYGYQNHVGWLILLKQGILELLLW